MIYSLPITPQSVVRRQFSNGLVVVLAENHSSASVALEGQILSGSMFEPAGQDGLANLTAALLRRGTQQHSFNALNQFLDNVGASLSISADDTYASISGKVLADDLPMVLDLTAEMLLQPSFREEEFLKLRGQLLTNLGIYMNDTGYRAGRAFMEALYPAGHPYARSRSGTPESIAGLTNEAVQRFYRAQYHPATCVLTLCGALRVDKVLTQLERLFADWQVAGAPSKIAVPTATTPPGLTRVQVPLPDKSQVDMYWGGVGISRLDPDYYAARVADLVLGRLGLMGRLGNRIRDELGLAYYISSHLESGIGPVPWIVSAGVNPAFIDRTVDELVREIRRLRDEPISDEELADSHSFLVGSMPLDLETNGDIADEILTMEEYNLGYDYLQRYPDIITGVSKQDIQRVVNTYLDPDRYVLALSGSF